MSDQSNSAADIFRQRFEAYQTYVKEVGEEKALEKIFEGYPERHRKNMGRFINNASLAEGFSMAIKEFTHGGWDMSVVDISGNGMDAVIEIQRGCPALAIAREFGYEKPCFLVCNLDGAASRIAFPEMQGEVLCRIADGASACVFKYERKATAD
jgi:predicted ArsR family transcriptional regulator